MLLCFVFYVLCFLSEMSTLKRKLDIGSVQELFDSDSEETFYSCVSHVPTSGSVLLNDGMDELLFASCERVDNPDSALLNDGMDEILNASCDRVDIPELALLNDGMDELLNASCERVDEPKPSMIPENLLYAVRNTKKEMKRNRVLAQLRLIETRSGCGARFRSEMSDFFFPLEQWPTYAMEILLSNHFGYSERIGLACFFHGNGLRDSLKALRVFHFYNKHWRMNKHWLIRCDKFRALFDYLDQVNKRDDVGADMRQKYFYYDISLNLTLYYDGYVRKTNGDRRKYFSIFGKYNGQ